MANHVSAAKRARQRFGRTARNRLVQGALRSSLKRAASKGVLHRNAAARLSSRLQRALNKLTTSS
jgi:ribosomal protein S20